MIAVLYFIFLTIFTILFMPFFILVWLITVPFDKKRTVVHFVSLWLAFVIFRSCPLWKAKISGTEHVEKGVNYIVIPNHESMLDIPLIAEVPNLGVFRFITKKELTKMPFIGCVSYLRGDILIDRGGLSSTKRMLYKCKALLQQNISITLFAEGTRSKTGRVEAFKEGAFITAKIAGAPILPVVICGEWEVPKVLGFGLKMPKLYTMVILEPVPVEVVKKLPLEELTKLVRDRIVAVHKELSPNAYE